MKAEKLIDVDQMWFWEKDWQEAEIKAERDIREGNVSSVFKTAENGISYLRKRRKEIKRHSEKY